MPEFSSQGWSRSSPRTIWYVPESPGSWGAGKASEPRAGHGHPGLMRPLGADGEEQQKGLASCSVTLRRFPRAPSVCPAKRPLLRLLKCPPLAKLLRQRQTGILPPPGSLW